MTEPTARRGLIGTSPVECGRFTYGFDARSVRHGDGAVIAANAHVVRSVAPYEIVTGNPARGLRRRFSSDIVDLLLTLAWWDLPLEHIRDIRPVLCGPPDETMLRRLVLRYRTGDDPAQAGSVRA